MKKVSLSTLFLILSTQIFGQIHIYKDSLDKIIQNFTGQGIGIKSIKFTGDSSQIGIFNFNPFNNTGMDDGIILSTGDVSGAIGPNKLAGQRTDFGRPGDIDCNKLTKISNSSNFTGDAAFLELEFYPGGNQLEFKFLFASDEYKEFISRGYFDNFVLLLKGPGINYDKINGTNSPFWSDSFKNLGVVDDSIPISTGTINQNIRSQYYHDYPPDYPSDPHPLNILHQFDGFTDVFTVSANVQCGKLYKLKIAIADVNDRTVDAWVLLSSKSLKSNMDVGDITKPNGILCQGSQYQISVTGSNSYKYIWDNSSFGKTLNFTPQSDYETHYLVVIDTVSGCSLKKQITLGQLHASNNVAPFLTGINNSNNYTYWINATKSICFDIFGFETGSNEKAFIVRDNILGNSTFNVLNNYTQNPKGTFCWQPSEDDIGRHTFTVTIKDDNKCELLSKTYTFTIVVICPSCPIDIYFENRSNSTVPLPELTVAANKIIAGYDVEPDPLNGPVIVHSNDTVVFKAGTEISLDSGFSVESFGHFTAIIEDVCVSKYFCDTCCVTPKYIFISAVPNVFTPNGDGYNDVWQVVDYQHPNCAYNALEFELYIYDSWGILIHKKINNNPSLSCCKFVSPTTSTDNNTIASINWDGKYKNGSWATAGTYYCVLKIKSCVHDTILEFPIQLFNGSEPPTIAKEDTTKQKSVEIDWFASPNPVDNTSKIVVNNSFNLDGAFFQLYNTSGQLLFQVNGEKIKEFNFYQCSPGFYIGKLYIRNIVITKKLIRYE